MQTLHTLPSKGRAVGTGSGGEAVGSPMTSVFLAGAWLSWMVS